MKIETLRVCKGCTTYDGCEIKRAVKTDGKEAAHYEDCVHFTCHYGKQTAAELKDAGLIERVIIQDEETKVIPVFTPEKPTADDEVISRAVKMNEKLFGDLREKTDRSSLLIRKKRMFGKGCFRRCAVASSGEIFSLDPCDWEYKRTGQTVDI